MMKNCPSCGTANAPANKFCQQCGHALEATAPLLPDATVSSDATIAWSGQMVGLKGELRRQLSVELLFHKKQRLVIGRASDCDVRLPHPMVSRYHALLERLPEGFRLRDLGSVNGVSVGGQRISEPVFVRERERVGIGPFLFSVAGGVIHTLDSSQSVRLEARHLEKAVSLGGGQMRKLLDDINLVVEPGEFVSLLGPSGSGKSTLMDCLNGRRRATGGSVLANGEDFYRHFDSFRQSLGYVPQRDIVHTQLTVYRALYYTAKLRLPTDTGPSELSTRIEEVLQEMELVPHRDTLVANLSGGQIKRVSLGAELLARPCLLYIDEATSGLDAGTEARMMRLFRRLADEGKSIVCITHNVDNVDRCHLALVLVRGKLVFYGPPKEAPGYFGVHRISEIYDRLGEKELALWEQDFAASEFHQEFVQKRSTAPATGERESVPTAVSSPVALSPPTRRQPLGHQFRVLTARYAELMWGDRRSLRLLLLQAPIVAVFILLGFIDKPYQHQILATRHLTPVESGVIGEVQSRLPEGKAREMLGGLLESNEPVMPIDWITDPRYTYILLSIVAIAVLWFGCNNAAKEIVKEEAIYGRERAVNLGIVPYLGSKFLVLSIISAVQVLLLMLVIYGSLELLHQFFGHEVPPAIYLLGYVPQYGVLVLLAMCGVALGLFLSAGAATPDRANAMLPYVLIPQIILEGGIISVGQEPLHSLAMTLSPVYWAFRAIHRGATSFPPDFPFYKDYNDSVWLACGALVVQTLLLLLGTAWCLRRKDGGRV